MPRIKQSYAQQIASAFSPEILGPDLANDVLLSIRSALEANVIFGKDKKPEAILKDAVASAITDIEERASQLHRFLRDGPYEGNGDIPSELQDKRLPDEETSKVITFIYSHVVNCFQGNLAELLAAEPCAQLIKNFKATGQLPATAKLYVGDAILFAAESEKRLRKAADMHAILIQPGKPPKAVVHGVVEVKSYPCSISRLKAQLAKHIARAREGSRICITSDSGNSEFSGNCPDNVFTVAITPATWKLSRNFSYVQKEGNSFWNTDKPIPPLECNSVKQIGTNNWRIILRWSKEALAAAAYEMTFWYMEKLGEAIFSEKLPDAWSRMTPAKAGRNAAKMMLYYAIPRSISHRGEQRALALYNTYGFGYALGMNFRDAKGRREMLWSEDLHEIARDGVTKYGCSIWG
ncbi:MAG: hypothetical protein MUO63_03105 [Desulfobulbaceae bacterium]|nr:hypothetical protein [Desulfobulbaceae bacterium]